ncbi:hypothetical protein J1N35_028260 [Gossypium stocksii]|uniref:RNase H type-1 domain-containing protein n=1 Tax=Gossypium stocksii TaxID=47602 RepID=A0A9D3UVU5_9ROSI|nr:hypothetical protein J1N35_028260 [Gossypium stocksii]
MESDCILSEMVTEEGLWVSEDVGITWSAEELVKVSYSWTKQYTLYHNGIWNGLTIALDRGIDRLIILIDSQEAVQAIQSSTTKVSNSALVRRIQLFMAKIVYCLIHHVSIEYNKEANRLAKMTISNNSDLHLFEMPPKGLRHNSK